MTQYVRAINIANNSIKSFVFDTNTANTLNSAVVAESVAISANVSAQAVNTFVTLQVQQLANTPPSINVISITDSSYNVIDDTAANTGGGYLVITGTNFQSGAIVMVGSTNTAISTTFVDSSTLRAQIPAIAAGTYPVYVVNTNGGTAIRINGLTTSPFPAWSTGATLSNQNANTSFSVNLSANSDSSITYANTTALPAGTTLAANGLFSGTVTVGTTTAYSFDVKATDVENQDASRTFSLTVTVTQAGRLWTWGYNAYGQTGSNDRVYRSSPVQVGTGTNWSLVVVGADHSIATKTDGTLWTWGRNSFGILGTNNTVERSSPTQIGAGTNWNKISGGSFHTMATKTDGTLWLWGNSGYGKLGFNNSINRSSPTQIGTGTDWNQIDCAGEHSIATKTNNTLWIWGRGLGGALGLNNAIDQSSPVQVGSGTDWNLVSAGGRNNMAIKTDGTLWTWGQNTNGDLGLNNIIPRSSPTQVGTNTNWSKIIVSDSQFAAIKTDGTLWTWGGNFSGELGLNDRVARSSPVQVGTATNWNLVSGRSNSFRAIKTDGTLWAWGSGWLGGLGTNNAVYRSSPTQIGAGTNWILVDGNIGMSVAITSN